MTNTLFSSVRPFRVWLYTVGHSTLLLRSVKSNDFSSRIDILFKSVRRINIPTLIHGVSLSIITQPVSDELLASSTAEHGPKFNTYGLAGADKRIWIVAGAVAWHEDDRDDSDPSHFDLPTLVWR